MTDISKSVELYRLKAQMLDPEISPAQVQYYLDAADWMENSGLKTAEEAAEAMKSTPYYLGGAESIELDGINMRIRAMEEIGFDDVADIHRDRLRKFKTMGRNAYCFSQEWIDDYTAAAEAERVYAERKEVFGSIVTAYCSGITAQKKEDKKKADDSLKEALGKLNALGVSFDELASQRTYRDITMMTDKGYENFTEYVRTGGHHADDDSAADKEAERAAAWAKENRQKLIEVGKQEIWHSANCIAVPSDDPSGYEYIAMKEVDD